LNHFAFAGVWEFSQLGGEDLVGRPSSVSRTVGRADRMPVM
jgi:hypothetical protein